MGNMNIYVLFNEPSKTNIGIYGGDGAWWWWFSSTHNNSKVLPTDVVGGRKQLYERDNKTAIQSEAMDPRPIDWFP